MSDVTPGPPGAIEQRITGIRMNSELIDKLDRKTATIGIVGLGYVGLPLMLRYCEVGYKVVGFDIDQVKVDALRGKSYIEHIPPASIETARPIAPPWLTATTVPPA